MTFASLGPRPFPYGVNLDNMVLLDFDDDLRLSTIELLLPRTRSWKPGIHWPLAADSRECDLLLPPAANPSTMIAVRIKVFRKGERVDIVIGPERIETSLVRLGDHVRAVLQGDLLVGFSLFS